MKTAPSIQKALRRITTKDHRSLDQDYSKRLMSYSKQEILLGSSAHLCEGIGKFWDFESDSECEDLGDAEALAQRVVQSVLRHAAAKTLSAPPHPTLASSSTGPARPARSDKTGLRLTRLDRPNLTVSHPCRGMENLIIALSDLLCSTPPVLRHRSPNVTC